MFKFFIDFLSIKKEDSLVIDKPVITRNHHTNRRGSDQVSGSEERFCASVREIE